MSAWLEAIEIAGFSQTEADRLFTRPDPALVAGLGITLRPPSDVRAAYLARHAALQSAADAMRA